MLGLNLNHVSKRGHWRWNRNIRGERASIIAAIALAPCVVRSSVTTILIIWSKWEFSTASMPSQCCGIMEIQIYWFFPAIYSGQLGLIYITWKLHQSTFAGKPAHNNEYIWLAIIPKCQIWIRDHFLFHCTGIANKNKTLIPTCNICGWNADDNFWTHVVLTSASTDTSAGQTGGTQHNTHRY